MGFEGIWAGINLEKMVHVPEFKFNVTAMGICDFVMKNETQTPVDLFWRRKSDEKPNEIGYQWVTTDITAWHSGKCNFHVGT
jgi:hypothetical protein